ncbi:hypothetical protein [Streptomyces blastmyceticus]|uniref:Glycosyltransferase RgtA/B/C/D-like domain-containing protein n=1 Tax=Streptomyces blastmyceticus TaxID=68180 RepID=A0ABN0WU75_9ACTN
MWLLAMSIAFVGLGACAILAAKAPVRTHDLPVLLVTGALAGFTLVSLGVGGLFSSYRPVPLAVGAAVYAVLCWGLAWAPGRSRMSCRVRANLRLLRACMSFTARHTWRHPVTALVFLVAAAVYGLRAWLSLHLPAADYDGLMYHLVGPDKWVQAGRLVHTPENLWADTYPMGVELVAAWPSVYLHSVQYAPLAQLPCYLLGGLSVLSLARQLGARRSHALLAGCAFLLTPAVFAQANTLYVDASSASLDLGALSLAAGLSEAALAVRPRKQILLRTAATGLATGLAIGSKTSNLIILPLVALAILPQLLRLQNRKALHRGLPGRVVVVWALPVLAVGSWWYLRTWIAYGSPFYPVSLLGFPGRGSVEELVIGHNVPMALRGAGRLSQTWTSWADGLRTHYVGYDIRLGGLGPTWLLLILPGALVGLVLWLHSPRRRGPGRVLGFAAVLGMAVSPASWWARYVLISVGTLLPLAAYALTRLSRPRAGGRLPRLLAVGVRASAAGLLALSSWWGQSALPITTQQDPTVHGPDGQPFTPLHTVIDLAEHPDAAARIWPWFGYDALAEVPDGSVIALLQSHVQPFVHPLIGSRLQRRTTVLGNPTTADELAQQMHAARAHYVLLDNSRIAQQLVSAVLSDSTHFRLMNRPEQRIFGADLYELGSFPAAGTSLPSKALYLPDGQVEVTGT